MKREIAKLNNIDHADLRVITEYGEQWGDNHMTCLAYTTEMRQLQSTYPLLFQTAPDSETLLPVALLGLTQGENLFLSESGWATDSIPLMMRKGPFFIAKEKQSNGELNSVIAIDDNHPKIQTSEGEPLFLELGGYSDHLEKTIGILERIESSHEHTAQFAQTLSTMHLVSPVSFSITLRNGNAFSLDGFYGIDEEAVSQLGSQALGELHQRGFLTPLYMMIASQSQLSRLIALKSG